ncbi:hypothetical protein COSHB9_00830 [Companilactobacillus alimentarius]
MVKQFPEGYYDRLSGANQKVYDSLNDIYKDSNQSYEMQYLYHGIKRGTGYFVDLINFRTLLHPFFVEPSINNERLRPQSDFPFLNLMMVHHVAWKIFMMILITKYLCKIKTMNQLD